VRSIRSPLRLSGGERPAGRGPFRGEHTEQVLVELCGYSREQVQDLAEAGVFGERQTRGNE
jgi:crotonobetainyl-CoA:carnitine CoA-transferase CaiB-like acyl-CoA transferase